MQSSEQVNNISQITAQKKKKKKKNLKENVKKKKTIWTERSCVYFDETDIVESLIDKTVWFENSSMPTLRSWRVPIMIRNLLLK